MIYSQNNEQVHREMNQNIVSISQSKKEIDSMLDALENSILEFCKNQEIFFEQTLEEQMAMIKINFDNLFNKFQEHFNEEQKNGRIVSLSKERKFYKDHAIFLNDQNDILMKELSDMKLKYSLLEEDRNHYKNSYYVLKNRKLFMMKKESHEVRNEQRQTLIEKPLNNNFLDNRKKSVIIKKYGNEDDKNNQNGWKNLSDLHSQIKIMSNELTNQIKRDSKASTLEPTQKKMFNRFKI